ELPSSLWFLLIFIAAGFQYGLQKKAYCFQTDDDYYVFFLHLDHSHLHRNPQPLLQILLWKICICKQEKVKLC
ncbi:hypothetical protein ILYODFUR_015106, partial [Ilyodon furcidens]